MKKYGQRKLPELWTAQTLRCSKVQRQLHHVHMPWLSQLVGSLLGSAIGHVKGTVDRRKNGQTLFFFSQLLQSSSSLQWQLVPAAPTDSSLQFSWPLQKTPSTHPLRVTRTINWHPLLEGLGPRSTEFPLYLHWLNRDLSPSSNGSILQRPEFSHFKLTLVSKGSICVVWLKPPCNPYGSLFAFLVFPLLVNNSLCQAVC